jgi:hypothetical protein
MAEQSYSAIKSKQIKIKVMKKTVLFALLTVSIFIGCSNKPDIEWQQDELGKSDGNISIDGGMLGLDGVFVWNKEDEIIFNDYYSQIDTIISEKIISREVKYYCLENDNVSVNWTANGQIIDVKETKTWKGDLQKWLVIHTANLNIEGMLQNLQIEAIVQFHDKKVRRFKTIPAIKTSKNISDAFGFTFGTPRTEMNNYIGHDFSPEFSSSGMNNTYQQPFHLFEFSNGKLIKLWMLVQYLQPADYDLPNRCKIPENIQYPTDDRGYITDNIHILNPQEWTRGNLKIKVFNTTLGKILDMEGLHGYDDEVACLTIEKID